MVQGNTLSKCIACISDNQLIASNHLLYEGVRTWVSVYPSKTKRHPLQEFRYKMGVEGGEFAPRWTYRRTSNFAVHVLQSISSYNQWYEQHGHRATHAFTVSMAQTGEL